MRGLMWHSQTVGLPEEPKKRGGGAFPLKGSNATWWPLECSQNKGLCLSKYQRRARPLPFRALLPWRQRGRCAPISQKARGCCNLGPKDHIFHQLWSGCQLLTTSSWDPGWFTSTRSVTARDQLPEETHSTPGTVPLWCIQETEQPGLGRCIRHTAHLGQCSCQVAGHLSMLNLGRAQNTQPTGLCAFSEYSRTWVAERPWKCTKHRVHVGQCTCKTPWSLSSVDLGSTSCPGLRQTRCGPSTISIHHTWQQYLLAVSLLFQSTKEQVSLNKWAWISGHLHPLMSGWKLDTGDLQTEEVKINKVGATALRMTGETD